MLSRNSWLVVVAAGIIASAHVWKFAGAMELIRTDLQLSLVFSGVLLGIVQGWAMVLGTTSSFISQRLGLRACMLTGLGLLAAGSTLGAVSSGAGWLMASRVVEGTGFLLASVAGPPLIELVTTRHQRPRAMGWWSGFHGFGVFVAMVASTVLLQAWGRLSWRGWWLVMTLATLLIMAAVMYWVPSTASSRINWSDATARIKRTVSSVMPWAIGVIFAAYTLQWGATMGFLPEMINATLHGVSDGQLSPVIIGCSVAVVGLANGFGCVLTGRLNTAGVPARRLIFIGMTAMAVFSAGLYGLNWSGLFEATVPGVWGILVVAFLFSGFSAFVPPITTGLAVSMAPAGSAASVALVTQIYNLGNFAGPVIVAALASGAGTWSYTWIYTLGCSVLGVLVTVVFIPQRPGA